MSGFIDVLENFVALKFVQSDTISNHFNSINNERRQKKDQRDQGNYQGSKCVQRPMVLVSLRLGFQDKTSR
jgi:hypothetical protein